MGQQKSTRSLLRFISYVLGRRPDEFGLVLDSEGFVKIKELIKAVSEEDGWRHIRRSHVEDLLIVLPNPPVEIKGNRIRARSRDKLPEQMPAKDRPKLLFTCIRRRAYPHVLEKGISPPGDSPVILSPTREMAEKIGRRTDQIPVLLTIQIRKAEEKGVHFVQAGDLIYTTDFIPAGCFSGPALPKQKPKPAKPDIKKEEKIASLPGSFILSLPGERDQKKKAIRKNRKNEIGWKKNIRRIKRAKEKMWPR